MVWSVANGQSLEITAPPPQTIESGDWVNLAFRIQGTLDVERSTQALEPRWVLPPGWLVVIPPPKLPRPLNAPTVLPMTLQAPKAARAGDYDIGLMLGGRHASARVTVQAHHALSLSPRTEANTQLPRWDLDTPVEMLIDVSLTGNQAKAVRLQAKAPDGIKVELTPNRLHLNPGEFAIATLRLQTVETTRWRLGGHMLIRIIALDETSNTPLASISQAWMVHARPDSREAGVSWPVMGYVQHHARWPMHTQGPNLDWGLSGRWALTASDNPAEQSSNLQFSWATDRPWQRYVAYTSDRFNIKVGHQVFGERGVARPSQWAKGTSLAYGHQTRVGFDVFESRHGRYHRPWVEHGAWRYAWTRRSNPDASSDHTWSLAYQPKLASTSHRWDQVNIQLAGRGAGVAAWADLSYRPTSNQKVRMQFQSIPERDFSGLRAGEGWRVDAVRSASPGAHSGWMIALFRDRDRVMTHHLMGYIHRPLTGSMSARLAVERASMSHLSGLDLSLRGQLGSLAWRSALNTRGRWQLSVRGKSPNQSRWFVHHRRSATGHHASRAGLEGRHNAGWHWSMGLEHSEFVRPNHALLMSTEADLRWVELVGLDDLTAQPVLGLSAESQNALSMSFVKSVGRGGEWAWIIHQSLGERRAGALMLRYRWHHRFKAPIRSTSALGVVTGQVRSLADAQPIVGAWISLAGRSAQTDEQGRYRFTGVPPGWYRLELDQHHAIEGWLALDGYRQEVTVEPSEAVAIDWDLVAMGSIEGRIQWPIQSSRSPPQWSDYQLLGRCDGCPITHRHRMISIDPDGYFEATAVSPGLWRWRLQGPLLPNDHQSNLEEVEVMIQSHHVFVMRWVIDYRPTPIEWLSSEAVMVID